MPNRDELSQALVGCLKEVSSMLRFALSTAFDQRDALTANDAEALVKSCRAQDDILRRISESDQRAADIATELAGLSGTDPDVGGALTSAGLVSKSYDGMVRQELQTIADISAQVESEHKINKQLIANGLEIITCCLRTVATDTTPPAYSRSAALNEPQAYVLSLDRKA